MNQIIHNCFLRIENQVYGRLVVEGHISIFDDFKL